jgi:Kef-type K+ transport system membrane component KefB
MAALTPVVTKFILAPVYRSFVEERLQSHAHVANLFIMTGVLAAYLTIASFSGTSVLLGSFLAGCVLSYLPAKQAQGHTSFIQTFEEYFFGVQQYIFAPLFFASIGFAIPFSSLWKPAAIWRGIIYSLLMMIGKVACGLVIPIWSVCFHYYSPQDHGNRKKTFSKDNLWPSVMLGSAMVARGEIGLLIVQIGFNKTNLLSRDAFVTGVWAILLNTTVGPIAVGLVVKYRGSEIMGGVWGDSSVHDITRASTESALPTAASSTIVEGPQLRRANEK